MKKIISLILSVIIILSVLSGCAMGIGDNPPYTPTTRPTQPIETEEPTVSDDIISIQGMFYRTTNGAAILLSQDVGPLILRNSMEEFDDILNFAIIKAEVETILESYPAQTTISNWDVTNKATIIDDYRGMVKKMRDLGYIPEEPFTEEDEPYIARLSQYDRYAKIMDASTEANTLFSPLSLNFALGMLGNATAEEYNIEFDKYFGVPVEEYNDYLAQYMTNAQPANSTTSIEIANGVWVNEGYTLKEEYENIVRNSYAAEVVSKAFSFELIEEINEWCSEKTHEMIPEIINNLSPEATNILINALYFNADWMEPYQEYQVQDVEFKNTDNSVSTVVGLHSTAEYAYYENDKAIGFSKPYADGRYSFIGILPKSEGDFTMYDLDLESFLAGRSVGKYDVTTMIPKFAFDNSHEMLPMLTEADFPVDTYVYSNMVNEAPLSVDRIVQKTAINLTESGTTAAAVTAVIMKNDMMIEEEVKLQREVLLNRPFAFMIYDNEAEMPLFIGKITTL